MKEEKKTNIDMSELSRLKGLVVERIERVDPEDHSIGYSLMFVVVDDELEGSEHSSTFQIETDNKTFFNRFAIHEEYALSFLAEVKSAPLSVVKN